MCELLGINFNEPVKPNISVKGFVKKGERNPDGWGIAYYPDEAVQIIKEPIEAGDSNLSDFIRNYQETKSKIFIVHVRKSSVGSVSYKNTHPFSRELSGRDYAFTHNGSLEDFKKLDTGRFMPIGDTDSEHLFCHLLNEIELRKITEWTSDDFIWLNQLLLDINETGKLNSIFSDGRNLFCYHDINDFKDYCLVRRQSPYDKIKLLDDDFEVDLFEEKQPTQKGYIIATNPLTDEAWEPFLPGELKVFRDGEIIFSGPIKELIYMQSSNREEG